MTGKNKIYIHGKLNEIRELARGLSHANIYDKEFPIAEDFKSIKRIKRITSMIENNLLKRKKYG